MLYYRTERCVHTLVHSLSFSSSFSHSLLDMHCSKHTHTHTHTQTHTHTHMHTHTVSHTQCHTCTHTHTHNKQQEKSLPVSRDFACTKKSNVSFQSLCCQSSTTIEQRSAFHQCICHREVNSNNHRTAITPLLSIPQGTSVNVCMSHTCSLCLGVWPWRWTRHTFAPGHLQQSHQMQATVPLWSSLHCFSEHPSSTHLKGLKPEPMISRWPAVHFPCYLLSSIKI